MKAILLSYKGGKFVNEKTGELIDWEKIIVSSTEPIEEQGDSNFLYGYDIAEISIPRRGFVTNRADLRSMTGKAVDLIYDQVFGRKNPVLIEVRSADPRDET